MEKTSLLENRVKHWGQEIFSRSQSASEGIFNKGYWSNKVLDWSMKNQPFKITTFRFVDVLPSLNSSDAVSRHLKEYFLGGDVEVPPLVKAALKVGTCHPVIAKLSAASVRANVGRMSSTFITGRDSKTAAPNLEKLWNSGFSFTVDILGEAVVAESEAQSYQSRYLELVSSLPDLVKTWKKQDLLEKGVDGSVPRANISVKLSSLYSQIDPMAHEASVEAIKNRLRPILQMAVKKGAFINLDMEQNDLREITLSVAEDIFCEPEFKDYPHFGLVIQAYLKCAIQDIERVKALALRRGTRLTVRLVKGAYWDFEVAMALQRSWPIPVFTSKAATDANYEECTQKLLQAFPHIHLAMGSHNVRSLAFGFSTAEALAIPKEALEVQMLHGMADHFKVAVKDMGYRVREYAPVGEMLPGMAYLVRRLLENTSNEGFLRAHGKERVETERLLENPALKATLGTPVKGSEIDKQHWGLPTEAMMSFVNAPIRDFSVAENRKSILSGIEIVKSQFPITVHPYVNGQKISPRSVGDYVSCANPSISSQIVSKTLYAGVDDAERALEACKTHMKSWASIPVEHRIGVLEKAAAILTQRRDELAALLCLEVAKNFREADADVAEAIDFCSYYAEAMKVIAKPLNLPSQPGEQNHYLYRPRGCAVVIAPWNFPLAILCGMAVAPLVGGNPVIMKPAEQSCAIALKLYEILIEAGVPAGVLHLLPGKGEVVGAHLVSHPSVHMINFTGSRAVGLHIMEEAARVQKGQKHIKKVLAEMGGKNAILVDEDADLDEVVVGALQSALGFQGQKCSALSRLIVVESCVERLKERLKEALKSYTYGAAEQPEARLGPVIDKESQQRLLSVIERNKSKIFYSHPVPDNLKSQGYFVPATIFESNDFDSELGQQEFFGPLFCIFPVKNFEEGIAAFNNVEYALTGGVYTRSPKNLEKARELLEVGNLYINRGITGALVARQPFGGYKLSGVGAKAGGPDYLRQFMEPLTQCENTMRRGFSPEI